MSDETTTVTDTTTDSSTTDTSSSTTTLSPKMQEMVQYLTDSLMLDTPMIQEDSAFSTIEEKIPNVVTMTLYKMGKETIEELDSTDFYKLHLMCLKTLYLRLAVTTAPEFTVSAEQVKFYKGDRFTHFTTLADKIAKELEDSSLNIVEFANLKLASRNGSKRNYELSEPQTLGIQALATTDHSIELGWRMFNVCQGEFYKYRLLYSETEIYDEYASPRIRNGNDIISRDFRDIKRVKYRLSPLTPNTKYYIVLIVEGRDGGKSYEQIEVTTSPLEEDDT